VAISNFGKQLTLVRVAGEQKGSCQALIVSKNNNVFTIMTEIACIIYSNNDGMGLSIHIDIFGLWPYICDAYLSGNEIELIKMVIDALLKAI